MDNYLKWSWILTEASWIILLLLSVTLLVYRYFYIRREGKKPKNTLLIMLPVFFLSVWTLRYAVGLYNIYIKDNELNASEEIANSFLHALQTFSMDEEYTEYTGDGNDMIAALKASGGLLLYRLSGRELGIVVYKAYSMLLNVVSPLWGGAVILSALKEIFPNIRLFFARFNFIRKKHIFSQLNEPSLEIAKSILKSSEHKRAFFKPYIIFADVYHGDAGDGRSEIITKARDVDAICVKNDIKYLNAGWGRKEYWLVVENDADNITMLSKLCDHCERLKNSIVRVFYHSDSYALTEYKIREQIQSHFKDKSVKVKSAENDVCECGKGKGDEIIPDMPIIHRTRIYGNMIQDILNEGAPLYEPLLERDDRDSLDVAIIGNGYIGTEMLMSTYWCGQLGDTRLSVNLVSTDSVEEAISKINRVNTDILLSAQKDSELLRIYSRGSRSEDVLALPYFTFRYASADAGSDNIVSLECENIFDEGDKMNLLDADYYFVATGTDASNIGIAESITKEIAKRQKMTGKCKRVTVAYVVYNSHLCKILNNSPFRISENVRSVAVGNIKTVYNYDAIRKHENRLASAILGEKLGESNFDKVNKAKLRMLKKANAKIMTEVYNAESDKAARIHYVYKVFAAYCYKRKHEEGFEDSWDEWSRKCQHYIFERDDGSELLQELAWIEHRRWNAYLRSRGFKHNSAKDINVLLLHNCLVECKRQNTNPDEKDLLDEAGDYKKYDKDCICREKPSDAS
ncbi:MAG: hypothetical protein IKV53_07625 [Clostridia bacterium]|nr:hypothetical protein [Clostridia bacterium]